MSSAKAESRTVDQARRAISGEFARLLNAGALAVRVRIVRTDGEPSEAWFYVHREDRWQKEPAAITDRKLVVALEQTLDMLGSRQHADEWSVRKRTTADFHDTDFKFHRDKIKSHLGARLESALIGLLFRDTHDSKKDKRHGIRTPRQVVRHAFGMTAAPIGDMRDRHRAIALTPL